MRLLITTPTAVVVDDPDVAALRAEDESGSFGILHGHADFLTALAVSVVAWKRSDGAQRYCAVRRGVLRVSTGNEIAIATREAIPGDDLDHLETGRHCGSSAARSKRPARHAPRICSCR